MMSTFWEIKEDITTGKMGIGFHSLDHTTGLPLFLAHEFDVSHAYVKLRISSWKIQN